MTVSATGRWIRDQLAFLLIVAGLAGACVYLLVEPGHWVRGTIGLAIVSLLATVLRLVLPTQRAGLLAVRSRWLDSLVYLLFGGLILFVALYLRLKRH